MLCIVLLFNNVNESAFVRLYYLLSENAYVCRMYIRCIGLGNVMICLLQACKDNKHYPDPRGQINLVIIQLHHMIDDRRVMPYVYNSIQIAKYNQYSNNNKVTVRGQA